MTDHSSKYIGMAARVREELRQDDLIEESTDLRIDLYLNEARLHTAETQLVKAYREFRALLKEAAGQGSKLAARYLEETTWDLT